MVFGSLVELHVWLHSCLCFSFLEKLFEKLARHLLDTFSTPGYLSSFQAFSYCNLNTSSTPGGSIEPHLLWLMFLNLDTFSTLVSVNGQIIDTWLDTSRHLHLSRALLRFYIFFLVRFKPHFSRSLSLDSSISSSPKHSHLTPNLLLKVSSSFFKSFFTW